MKNCYLEVTFRKGRALAAYYYLPREEGQRSAWTEQAEGGLLIDHAADGRAIGIEIVSPSRLDLAEFNRLLVRLGQPPVDSKDIAPLAAA